MCRAHHQRWWRTGDPNGGPRARPRPTELPAAFWDLVERTEHRWLWRGTVDVAGYAQWHGWSAALLVYEALVGPVPPGHVVGLACPDSQRRCVWPEHRRPIPRGGRYDPVHGIVTFGTAIEQCRNGHTRTPENPDDAGLPGVPGLPKRGAPAVEPAPARYSAVMPDRPHDDSGALADT